MKSYRTSLCLHKPQKSPYPLINQPTNQSIKHTPPTPLTRPPHPLPKNIKHKRHRNQQRRKPPRNTTRRPHPQIPIQRRHHERKRARKATPQESIRRHRRRGIQRKRIDEVIQRGLENGEKPRAHHHKSDDGRDPGERRVGGPAHYELPRAE